jgi:integrase
MKSPKGRPNTVRVKESLFRNWVAPNLADDGSNLDEVVDLWEVDLQPGTVKCLLYIAKAHVKDETGKDLDIKAHVKRIGRSKQQLPPKALARDELAALSAVIPADDPLYIPFHIGINTGMRRGEVWGLRWEDVDLLRGQITVSRSYNGPTKSGKSRLIPISQALETILLEVAKFGNKSYNDSKRQRTGLIIKSTFDPNPLLKRRCKEAGIKEITFHSLRHTFATFALDAGCSPVLVSRVLGHSSVVTTLSVYWNASAEKLDLGFLSE